HPRRAGAPASGGGETRAWAPDRAVAPGRRLVGTGPRPGFSGGAGSVEHSTWSVMSDQAIAVIDTGICNLRSVTKALEAVGAHPVAVRSPAELEAVENAGGLVLPGVGALRDCVEALRATALDTSVRQWIEADRPFLGVCLGMQALFERSEEGDVTGLGIFGGEVRRFRLPPPFKVPHMGWNQIRF